jgi:co-chaperonin GroES (HSP10)
MKKIEVTKNRILVTKNKVTETTKSGIIVPTTNENIVFGTVIAAGDEVPYEVNDEVFFQTNAGTEFEYESVKYLILSFDNVLGRINNKK